MTPDIDPVAELAEVDRLAEQIVHEREHPPPPEPYDEYAEYREFVDSYFEYKGLRMRIRMQKSVSPRGWGAKVDREMADGSWDWVAATSWNLTRRGARRVARRFRRAILDHHITWGQGRSCGVIRMH